MDFAAGIDMDLPTCFSRGLPNLKAITDAMNTTAVTAAPVMNQVNARLDQFVG
jgi:hypothetical protein